MSNESRVIDSKLTVLSITHGVNHGFLLFFTPMLTLLIKDLNLTLASVGGLVTIAYIAFGIGALPAGIISDYCGRKLTIFLSVVIPSAGAILASFGNSYWIIAVAFILIGIGSSFYHPASYAMISDLSAKNTRGKAFGIHGVGGNIGSAVSPAFAGIIAALWSWRLGFIAWGIVGLIDALFIYRILPEIKHEANKDKKSKQKSSMAQFFTATILIVLLILAIQGFVNDGVFSFLPTFLQEQFALGVAASGIIAGVNYGGGILGQLLGGYLSDKYSRLVVLLWATVGCTASLLLLPAISGAALMVVVVFIMGFSMFMLQPAINALVADVTPAEILGTSFGIVFIAKYGLGSLAPLVGGLAGQYSSLAFFFYIMAGIMAVTIFLVMYLITTNKSKKPQQLMPEQKE